jgi:HK97 family phage major capsid protein
VAELTMEQVEQQLADIGKAVQNLHDPDFIQNLITDAISGMKAGAPVERLAPNGDGGEERGVRRRSCEDLLQKPTSGNELLEEFKQLNDVVHTCSVMLRKDPASLNCYRDLRDVAGEVQKAFNTTDNADFIPTGFSDRLLDTVRQLRRLPNLVQNITLSRSPMDWPVGADMGLPYMIDEPKGDTAALIPTRDAASDKMTWSADYIGLRVALSRKADENSVVDAMPYIMSRMARSMVDGQDALLLSGDNSATHMDTASVTDSRDCRRLRKGLRKHAIDLSTTYNAQDASSGHEAAFTPADLVRTLDKLDPQYAEDIQNLLWVTSTAALYKMMADKTNWADFQTIDKIGNQASNVTGQVAQFMGSPIVVDPYMGRTLNASGLQVAGGTTTGAVVFHREAIALATQEQVQMATVWDPEALQYRFVIFMSLDVQAWRATDKWVAYCINIPTL